MERRKLHRSIALAFAFASTVAIAAPVTVTPQNFVRAESDTYFANLAKEAAASRNSSTGANPRRSKINR